MFDILQSMQIFFYSSKTSVHHVFDKNQSKNMTKQDSNISISKGIKNEQSLASYGKNMFTGTLLAI